MRKFIYSLFVLGATFSLASCSVDDKYSWDEILDTDLNVTLFEKGLEFPIGTTDVLKIGDLVALGGSDISGLDVDADGNYVISMSEEMDMSDQLKDLDLSALSDLDAITIDQNYDFDLDIDKDAISVKASNWSSEEALGFSNVTPPTLNSISQNQDIALDAFRRVNAAFSINDDLPAISESVSIFQFSSTTGSSIKPMATVALGPRDPVVVPKTTKNVIIDHTIDGVDKIDDIVLSENSSIIVTLSVDNNYLTSGDIIPNLNIDLQELLQIKGFEGKVLNIKDLVLNKSNNYTNSKTYKISKLAKSSFTGGRVYLNGDIVVDGQIEAADLVGDSDLAATAAANGGMKLNYSVSFSGISVSSCSVGLSKYTVDSKTVTTPVNFTTGTLPEAVDYISSVSFSSASKVVIDVKSDNLSNVPGLVAALDELVVEFPDNFHIEGYPTNVVKLSGTVPFKTEIAVASVDVPAPVNGQQSFTGNVTIKAKASATGTVNTADLPTREADDIIVYASLTYSPVISDYVVHTKDYVHSVNMTHDVNVSIEGIGDLGNCTIKPKGSPAVAINFNKPAVDFTMLSDGLTFTFPSAVGIASDKLASGLTYNSANNSVAVNGTVPAEISIPIKDFTVDSSADNKTLSFGVSGAVKVAADDFNKTEVETLANGKFNVSVNIPEIKAESVSFGDDFTMDIDQTTSITFLNKDDVSDMVDYLTEINFDNVNFNCDIDVTGLPNSTSDFVVDAVIKLPDFVEPASIPVKGAIKNGKLTATPTQIVRLKDIDLKSGNDIIGDIQVKGTISAAKPEFDINSLGDIKATIKVKIANSNNKIAISSIKARCNYDLSNKTNIALDEIPDVLKGDNVCLDIKSPQLLLEIGSNLGIPLGGSIELVPWRNGAAQGNTVSVKDINLPYSTNASEQSSVKICIGGDASSCPSGYDYKEAELARVFRQIPDSIVVNINAAIDKTKDCIITPSANYGLNLKYDFNMPLAVGSDFLISLSDTLAFDSSIADIIAQTPICLELEAKNAIPLGLDLFFEFLDADGNILPVTENELKATIEAGSLSAPVESTVDVMLKARANAPTDKIESLLVNFTLKGGKSGYESLSSEEYIIADIIAILPEGIGIDLGKEEEKE